MGIYILTIVRIYGYIDRKKKIDKKRKTPIYHEIGAIGKTTDRGCATGWTGDKDYGRKRTALGATGDFEREQVHIGRRYAASRDKLRT